MNKNPSVARLYFTWIVLTLTMLPLTTRAAESTETALSCNDFRPTPQALARFPDLEGACDAVVERNGELYGRFTAIVRRTTNRSTTLYLPATDHTFTIEPQPDARVIVDGKKVRPRNLTRGQEIRVYLAVNAFSTPDIQEIALVTEADIIISHPVSPAAALPTTASPWPTFGLFSITLVGIGLLLRLARLNEQRERL